MSLLGGIGWLFAVLVALGGAGGCGVRPGGWGWKIVVAP